MQLVIKVHTPPISLLIISTSIDFNREKGSNKLRERQHNLADQRSTRRKVGYVSRLNETNFRRKATC